MCPPPIPRMSTCKNEATESQRQSEAIRGNQSACHTCTEANRDHQMQSGRTSDKIRRNQTQSDAFRRNQAQSDAISMPGALCFRVFVFWAGRKGLCFVFLCFEPAQRACVLCFRVLADPPQNTGGSQFRRMYVVAPRFDTRILIVTCPPVGLQCAVRARVTDQCRLSRVSRNWCRAM